MDFNGNHFTAAGSAKIQDVTGTYTFDSLSTAPDISNQGFVNTEVGKVYLLVTKAGQYCKFRVTSITVTMVGGDEITRANLQYALQTDGTRNLRTN